MPRMLGDAFVVISPDTSGFRAKADAQIKAALAGLKYTVPIGIDTEGTVNAIRALQARIRQMGLADFLDINIPVGKLITQIQIIKRLLNQAGVADILEVNLDKASLAKALALIQNLPAASVPVNFDVSRLPVVGPLRAATERIPVTYDVSKAPIGGPLKPLTDRINFDISNLEPDLATAQIMADHMPVDVPVNFDVSKLPVTGAVESVGINVSGAQAATAALAGLSAAEKVAAADGAQLAAVETLLGGPLLAIGLKGITAKNALAAQAAAAASAAGLSKVLAGDLFNLAQAQEAANAATGDALLRDANLRNDMADVSASLQAANSGYLKLTTAQAVLAASTTRLWSAWSQGTGVLAGVGGAFGIAAGKITLFSGIFAKIPLLGAISLWHAVTEGILEFAATLIPAGIALAAWGAAAASTFVDVYKRVQSLYTAQQALQQQLTLTFTNAVTGTKTVLNLGAAFQQVTNAVKPQVYTLLGEGLYIISQRAGALNPVITSAGKVIDDLGARFAYAVTTGSAFNVFIKNASSDLAGWGNLIGNVGGIIGGVLKQLPGYGEIFLAVLNNLTHGIELFVNSGFGQALLGFGLAAHGAIIWIGLLSTAFTLLATRALAGLASTLISVGTALEALGASSAAGAIANAGRSLGVLAQTAGPIVGVVSLVAAGIGFLVYQLVNAKSAAQQFAASIQQNLQQAQLTALPGQITASISALSAGLAAASGYLAHFTALQIQTSREQVQFGAQARGGGVAVSAQAQAISAAAQNMANYRAGLQQVQQDQQTVNQHIQQAAGIFGSTSAAWAILNAAGITSAQILDKNGQHWSEALIEAQGYNAVLVQLTGSSGRYAAAQNALNFTADDTANTLGLLDADATKLTSAMTAQLNVITGGRAAYDSFEQGFATLGTDLAAITGHTGNSTLAFDGLSKSAAAVGKALGGTSQASFALNAQFYAQVTAAQNVINALTMQDVSTGDLTKAVATAAGQLAGFAGNNVEARSVIVALINQALGPNTVSLQTLNKWITNNSTSLGGFNAIIATSTIKAGTLANVLQTELNNQFHQFLLVTSGASSELQTYTGFLVHNQAQTVAGQASRQRLITDLENAGLSAHDATNYVNGLQSQINAMHGKTVTVGVNATGAGQVVITGSGSASIVGAGSIRLTSAQGGLVTMGTTPTADDVPALLSKGETVVSAADSKKLAGAFAAVGVPGYAFGGVAGLVNAVSSTESSATGKVLQADASKVLAADIAKAKAAIAAKAAALSGAPGGSASTGVISVAAYIDSHGGIRGTGAGVGGVVAGESGGDPEIIQQGVATPGEGILQWTPGSSAQPYQPIITGNPGRDMATQLADMLYYINQRGGMGDLNAATRSGGPMAAAQLFSAMEAPLVPGSDIRPSVVSQLAAMGYKYGGKVMDHGGWLQPGWNPPMYNGTGAPEPIGGINPGGTIVLEISGSSGSGTFDAFLTQWLKNNVRVKGGGNVQKAWGRTH